MRVGPGRTAKPEVALQQCLELGRDEAHLRGELAELLAGEREVLGDAGRAEDDRLAEQEAVLGAAEGDDVHPGFGGQLGERGAERRGGVGEARAVDVEAHPEPVGGIGDRPRLVERVNGPELGRLRDRDEPRLRLVLVAAAGLPALDVGGT